MMIIGVRNGLHGKEEKDLRKSRNSPSAFGLVSFSSAELVQRQKSGISPQVWNQLFPRPRAVCLFPLPSLRTHLHALTQTCKAHLRLATGFNLSVSAPSSLLFAFRTSFLFNPELHSDPLAAATLCILKHVRPSQRPLQLYIGMMAVSLIHMIVPWSICLTVYMSNP